MALTTCGDCGKEVSTNALACPNCGAPVQLAKQQPQAIPKTIGRTGGKYEAIGFVLIAVGVVAGIAGTGVVSGILIFVGLVVFIVGRFN